MLLSLDFNPLPLSNKVKYHHHICVPHKPLHPLATLAYPWGSQGAGLIPADIGGRGGVHPGQVTNQSQRWHIKTDTPTSNLQPSCVNLTCMSLWENQGKPTQAQREHENSIQKADQQVQTQNLGVRRQCTTVPLLINPLQLNIFQVNLMNFLHAISDPTIHQALSVGLMLALAFCLHLLLKLTHLTHFRVSGRCKCLSRRCSWLETATGHALCFCRQLFCFSLPDWLKTSWDVDNTYCTIFSFPHRLC